MAILRVRKCDVTLLMTVGTVCIAACTAVPRMMAITKLQAALCCLPAYCILSCTIWLTVLKFITSQLWDENSWRAGGNRGRGTAGGNVILCRGRLEYNCVSGLSWSVLGNVILCRGRLEYNCVKGLSWSLLNFLIVWRSAVCQPTCWLTNMPH